MAASLCEQNYIIYSVEQQWLPARVESDWLVASSKRVQP